MDSFDLNNYQLLDKIGSGNFGEVFKIQDKRNGKIYAAKISTRTLDEAEDDFKKNFEREVSIISKIHHPSILKFIGLSLTNFQNEKKPILVTDYLPNKSLGEIIELCQRGCSPEYWNDTMKLINIYGIASAMSFLHKNEILHRDLKPANILMDQSYYPVLADFGLSKEDTSKDKTFNLKGTPMYLAPEVISDLSYSKEADVYSYAIILYEIYANEKPFQNMSIYKLSEKVCNGYRPDTSTIPEPYKTLIENCWKQEPSERLSFDQIVSELENEIEFITDTVEEEEFYSYMTNIKDSHKSIDDTSSKNFSFETNKAKANKKVNLKKKKEILSRAEFNKLDKTAKKMVAKANSDPKKQFDVGQNLINGRNGFPKNVQAGVQYLEEAINGGNVDAVILYSRMLIMGNKIECDIEKAKNILKKFNDLNDPNIIFLQAKIARKEDDDKQAIELLKMAANGGSAEAMFALGQMIFLGEGCEENEREALKYFNMAKENGFDKGDEFFEKLKEKKKLKNKTENSKTKTKTKSKSKTKTKPENLSKKSVDIVFLIDGTNTNKFFYETLKLSFEEFANDCVNQYSSFDFKFGVVIYVDFIVSTKIKNCKLKKPLIMDLTVDIEKVQSFLNEHYIAGGGIRLANDWAVGYSSLIDKINWTSESSEKVVIQMCHTPGHGRSYTMRGEWHKKYFNIPKFGRENSNKENFQIFKDLQDKQRNWLIANISKIAEKGIKMYCLNGNEVAMYCFKRVSSAFFRKGGKKFIIKNLFGFTSLDKKDSDVNIEDLKDQIEDFLSNVVKSCTSQCDENENDENEFEKSCNQQFKHDFDLFFAKNDGNYKSTETTDNDSDSDADENSQSQGENYSNDDDDENSQSQSENYSSEDDDDDDFKQRKRQLRSRSSNKMKNPFDF